MDQNRRVTARAIIDTVVDSMKKYTEPLAYTMLAPSHYQVHLNTEDHERLAGIFTRIVEETKQRLDEELERQNRGPGMLRWIRKLSGEASSMVYEKADGDWYISFHENADEDVEAGAFDVSVELALPAKGDASGTKTRVITVRRSAEGRTRKIREDIESRPPSGSSISGAAEAEPAGREQGPRRSPNGIEPPTVYARLSYEDERGRQTYNMTKNQIVIGRGGVDYWVDVHLDASDDISREHLRLRRDPQTGKFYIKDMSTYGTTVNGEKIEPSVEFEGSAKKDKNVEVELPPRATVGLAGTLDISFEATGGL
jgi:pSer/pThr/pTyr-binding forkhead associated (FHA) protein